MSQRINQKIILKEYTGTEESFIEMMHDLHPNIEYHFFIEYLTDDWKPSTIFTGTFRDNKLGVIYRPGDYYSFRPIESFKAIS